MNRPNILLILADDLGFSDIGCFGAEISTPNLDRLGFGGLRFTQMYNTARCCPTRASLLTGLGPHQAGIGHMVQDLGAGPSYQGYLRDDTATVAEILRTAGYYTALAGKWHVNWSLGDSTTSITDKEAKLGKAGYPHPLQRGFDRFYGTLAGAGSYFDPHNLMEQDRFIRATDPDFYYTDAISDNAVKMIGEAIEVNKPFFVHVCYTAPHWPLHALPEDIEPYRGRYSQGWDKLRADRRHRLQELGLLSADWAISDRDEYAPAWESLDLETQLWEARRMEVYAAQISRMDQGIGRLIDALRRHGVEKDTLVIFLSDNGGCAEYLKEDGWSERYELPPRPWAARYDTPTRGNRPMRMGNKREIDPGPEDTFMSYGLPWANASNTPFRLFKHYVHEGGISTPMVLSWPSLLIRPGIRHCPLHVQDILPTLLEVANAEPPRERANHKVQPIEGESFYAVLADQDVEQQQRKSLCFEHEGNSAIRAGDWKAVRRSPGPWELYNMAADRTETTDLSRKFPEKLTALVQEYAEWAARCEVGEWVHGKFQPASASQPKS